MPKPPANVVAIANRINRILVQWDVAKPTPGAKPLVYVVELSNDGGVTWRTPVVPYHANYADFDKLAPGDYWFRVRSTDDTGVSEPSAPVSMSLPSGKSVVVPSPAPVVPFPSTPRYLPASVRANRFVYDTFWKRDRAHWSYPGTTPMMTAAGPITRGMQSWFKDEDRLVVDEDIVRRDAMTESAHTHQVFDCEWWGWKYGTEQQMATAAKNACKVIDILKEGGRKIGIYGPWGDHEMVYLYYEGKAQPDNDWWARNIAPGGEYYAARERLKRAYQIYNDNGLMDHSDYMVVSCYLFDDTANQGGSLQRDLDLDTYYVGGNIDTAIPYANNKEIVVFYMPHMHPSCGRPNPVLDGGDNVPVLEIAPERWTNLAKITRSWADKYAPGVNPAIWENWFNGPCNSRRERMMEEMVLIHRDIQATGILTTPPTPGDFGA